MRSSFMVAAALAGIAATLAAPLSAQQSGGDIVVAVTDSKTHAPIAGARVFLVGPAFRIATSDATGTVRFGQLTGGAYRLRVTRAGYDGKATAALEVAPGHPDAVSVALAISGPLTIGSVVTHTGSGAGTTDAGADSVASRLGGSLIEGLDTVAGVNVTQQSNDSEAPQTVSLHGHDDTQTGLTVDGVPLALPGTAVNLRSLGTDVFSGAHMSFEPTAGSPAGTVNFRTLEPTPALVEQISAQDATYDRSAYRFGLSDTVGRLGFAAIHSWRGANSPLTFNAFTDRSGIGPYEHGGQTALVGDALKLQYSLGARTTVKAAGILSNTSVAPLCTALTAATPCGAGPVAPTAGRTTFGYASIESLAGNVMLSFTAFGSHARQNVNELNRYVAGSADPFASTGEAGTNGWTFRTAAESGAHSFAFTTSAARAWVSDAPSNGFAFRQTAASTNVELNDVFRANDRLSLRGHVALANATGLGTSLLSGAGATLRANRSDTIDASASFGSSEPLLGSTRNVGDPIAARIDCRAGTAAVSGPGDPPRPQSATTYDASWTHTLRAGSFSVDAYRQTQTGQLIKSLVSEPASYFPAPFLGELSTLWQSPLVCGSTAPFPSGVYVQQLVGGTSRLYEGIDAGGRFALGRNLVVYPTYSLSVATLTGTSARLAGLESLLVLGAQLPGVPVHRAGLTLAGLVPRSGLEWLLAGQYTAGNNARRLGPYVVTSAGLAHRVGPGRLTATVTNLFNTDAGSFTTEQYALPILTSRGRLLETAAAPLLPRSFGLAYSFNLGAPPPSSALGDIAPRAAPSRHVPGSGAARFAGFPDAGPAPAGTDPLALRPSCDGRMQTTLAPLVEAIRRFAADVAAGRPLAGSTAIAATAHPATGAAPAWLELQPTTASLADFGRCTYVTVMAHHTARERGIVTSGAAFGFTGDLGLFFIRPPHDT